MRCRYQALTAPILLTEVDEASEKTIQLKEHQLRHARFKSEKNSMIYTEFLEALYV